MLPVLIALVSMDRFGLEAIGIASDDNGKYWTIAISFLKFVLYEIG